MLSSIRARILLLFVSGMLFIASIMIGFTLVEVRRHYTDLFGQRGQVAAQELANRADRLFRLGLMLDEFLGFEQQCIEVVHANPGISYAALADEAGRILYSSGKPPPGLAVTAGPRPLLITRMTESGTQHRGARILVQVDQAAIDEAVNGLLSSILLMCALVTLLGTLLAIALLQLNLGTPAKTLLRHIMAVDPDNIKPLPPDLPKRGDEIGTIAHAFDTLVHKLIHTQQALLAANDTLLDHSRTLENKVRERTRELRQVNRELQRLAHTDALTGLPNRLYFMGLLNQRYAHATRHGHNFALLLLDLNGFKEINDRFGHAAGDAVLQTIARRMSESLRGGDSFSRLGGDEFAVLVEEFADLADLTSVARKISTLIAQPFVWNGQSLSVGASIGIAVLNGEAGTNADELLGAADSAMYAAKRQGMAYSFAQDAGLQAMLHP